MYLYRQNRLLVAEQDSLQKMVEMSKNTGEYMLQLLKQHHKVLNETFAENYNLKNAQTLLSSKSALYSYFLLLCTSFFYNSEK